MYSIWYDRHGSLVISQYMLRKCWIDYWVSWPLSSNVSEQLLYELKLSPEDQQYLDNFPCCNLIGAALYLAMNTRADISYAMGVLSRLSAKLTIQSKLHTTVSTCSMQAEYQMIYACRNWCSFGGDGRTGTPDQHTPLFLDSQNTEDLALNSAYHKR